MSKLARALILGATLAAMNLVGLTAVAQAQSTDQPTSNQDARWAPTQGQVGEAWRQPQVAPEEPTVAGDTRRPPTESQVGRILAPPDRHPGAIGRAQRPVRLARGVAEYAGRCPGTGGRAGRAGHPTSRPPGSAWTHGLTTVT